jgi:hypothetical protein
MVDSAMMESTLSLFCFQYIGTARCQQLANLRKIYSVHCCLYINTPAPLPWYTICYHAKELRTHSIMAETEIVSELASDLFCQRIHLQRI